MSRRKILVAAAAVAAVIGVYALAGFYGVPRLVSSKVPEAFAGQYGRTRATIPRSTAPWKRRACSRSSAQAAGTASCT